jgi:hypothetical protein
MALHDTHVLEGFVNGVGLKLPQHEFELPRHYPSHSFGGEGSIGFLELFWSLSGAGTGA